MLPYAFKRIALSIPVLVGVIFVTFFMLHLAPGDPAVLVAGVNASTDDVEAVRKELGLDRPLLVQFGTYMVRLVQGDLGRSARLHRSVAEEIAERLPATIELAVLAMLIATVIGVVGGVISAVHRGSLLDDSVILVSLTGISMPAFWLGLLLILLFSHRLGWLPVTGRSGPFWTLDGLRYAILPAFTLAISSVAYIIRLTRTGMLDVLQQDYVRTARAKGLPERIVIYKHCLRNASLPVVTFIGAQTGALLANAVVVETVFAWPGLSRLIATSVFARDLPMVQGSVLVLGMVFVLANIVVDLSYALLDPRIRFNG